jgi:uncharacterized membrane protein
MGRKVAITVLRSREEVQRLWESSEYRPENVDGMDVSFVDAPGDRGTEIHVEVKGTPPAGRVGEVVQKLVASEPRAKAMDVLRRFKQLVETGVIARSDAAPEGERAERKLKQRPAQPLDQSELEKAGV